MKTSKAVLYTRVSTGEQAESGTSLEAQELACLRKAAELGLPVVGTFSDPGVSGALYLGRPGIQAALSALESRQADTLIIYKLDRSGRDVDVIRAIRKRVEVAGGRLVFADGMNFDSSATGKLMFTQLAGFAEFERELIRERTMLGMRRRAEQGQQPSRARSPYGYHVVIRADVLKGDYPADQLGSYQIVEAEAHWVKEIFRRYADGESLEAVCRWLNAQGVRTPRNGDYWRRSSLRTILSNPAYKGEPAFGRTVRHSDESRLEQGFRRPFVQRAAPVENCVTLTAPALVSADLWDACQQKLVSNKGTLSGNPKRRFLLGGLLRCPLCGRGMHGSRRERRAKWGRWQEFIYQCPDSRPSCNPGGHVCNNRAYDAAEKEKYTRLAVSVAAHQKEKAQKALRAWQEERGQSVDTAERERLSRELAALEARERAAVEAQIQGIAAGANPAVYAGVFAEMKARREAIAARLEALEAEERQIGAIEPETEAQKLAEVMAAVEEVLNDPIYTEAEKHDFLAQVVAAIDPVEGGVRVRFRPRPSINGETVHSITVICPSGRGSASGGAGRLLS